MDVEKVSVSKETPKKKLWSKQSMYTAADGREVEMDSSWETALATLLDELEIKWDRGDHLVFEYRTPRNRKRKYIPDFYLPDYDIYVEVKGYWTDAAKLKVQDVQERHGIRLLVLESLAEIGDVRARIDEHLAINKG